MWTFVTNITKGVDPATRLGRWCGPWYNKACNAMNKGWLADMDNSVWDAPPPKAKQDADDRSVVAPRR